jgi:glycosyltransferase involved in cell wall biosynthesis
MMEETERVVRCLLEKHSYDVSFAMQTIIPVLRPLKPHFIYTDLCIKANALYPVGAERLELWKECIEVEERGLKACAGVFVMSEHVKQVLIDAYGVVPERVHRVNGGCNSAVDQSFDPNRYRRRNILFIGTDWKIKAGDHLVRAFRVVRGRYPDAVLTIVGCRPDVSGPGIEVVGPVPASEIAGYLAKASMFSMVSLREAFGIAYIEAMRAALPVIAADLGATPDFVINDVTGYRVAYDDLDDLIERLCQLLADPELCERLGTAGRDLVMREYTWEATLKKMAEVVRASV